MAAPQNRRQRRAAAKDAAPNTPSTELPDADSIPLTRPPPSSKPKGKTLYEIAAERQAKLADKGQPFTSSISNGPEKTKLVKIAPDGTIVEADNADGELKQGHGISGEKALEEISPIFDTLFTSLTLSALHYTLSVLTAHQYAQELKMLPLFYQTLFLAFPILTFLVHLAHGHAVQMPAVVQTSRAGVIALQALWVVVANVSGCYLVHITSEGGYYAVMKRAPSVGTLWVWSVLELGLAGALMGVVGPGGYAWWKGYGIW